MSSRRAMADDDPSGKPLQGGGRSPRPIGLDHDEATPLDTSKKGGSKPAQAATELNIVADFPNQYGGLAAEVQAIKGGRWGPTTDDFVDITVNSLTCNSFAQFGATILLTAQGKERPKQSIGRINLFTHANPDLIAFKGTVKPLSIGVDVQLEVGSGLQTNALQSWNASGFFLEDPNTKKKYTLADIRTRFTGKSAEIWLYACHSGVDGSLLQDTADTFQATVIGFVDAIAYCPAFTESPPSIDRKHLGVKTCASSVTDFRSLPTTNTTKKTPK